MIMLPQSQVVPLDYMNNHIVRLCKFNTWLMLGLLKHRFEDVVVVGDVFRSCWIDLRG
jgi:hypothetical protein